MSFTQRIGIQGTAHACGTLIAGNDPRDSVVDARGQVHGLKGLFVADGSVLPRVSRVNPSLTIYAWGLRVGDLIAESLRREGAAHSPPSIENLMKTSPSRLLAGAAILLWCVLLSARAATPGIGVDSVGIPVSDMERSRAFYSDVLGFRQIADREVFGEPYEKLYGVFGVRLRSVRMQLGDEFIELMQFQTPRGRPLPVDSRSNDRWFQHVAIIVSDMDKAYGVLARASRGIRLYRATAPARLESERRRHRSVLLSRPRQQQSRSAGVSARQRARRNGNAKTPSFSASITPPSSSRIPIAASRSIAIDSD